MMPSACATIRRCAGLSAAKRRSAARLRRVRWGASRRNGSRRPRTSLLLATCLASGSTLCTAEGHPVASCSTWGAPIKQDQQLAVATPPARRHWAQRVISASGNPTNGHNWHSGRSLTSADIERSGRAANCATTTARDPEIIDPITVECVEWLERNTETLRSGAAWDKRSREHLAIAIAGSTVRRKNRSKVRQAVAGRIKAELTAYGFKFPGCDL